MLVAYVLDRLYSLELRLAGFNNKGMKIDWGTSTVSDVDAGLIDIGCGDLRHGDIGDLRRQSADVRPGDVGGVDVRRGDLRQRNGRQRGKGKILLLYLRGIWRD